MYVLGEYAFLHKIAQLSAAKVLIEYLASFLSLARSLYCIVSSGTKKQKE